jgi:hypothetical protein
MIHHTYQSLILEIYMQNLFVNLFEEKSLSPNRSLWRAELTVALQREPRETLQIQGLCMSFKDMIGPRTASISIK